MTESLKDSNNPFKNLDSAPQLTMEPRPSTQESLEENKLPQEKTPDHLLFVVHGMVRFSFMERSIHKHDEWI